MPNRKYADYIEIDPSFESVVDIDADSRNNNLWRNYIVGEDMKKLMEKLCLSLNWEEPDSRWSFWIEGTYGTGKSYAAIVVKHLLEEKPEAVRDYLSSNGTLSAFCNRFMKCRDKDKGDYLVIWKTGCTGIHDGNALLMEMERAVRRALKEKFGDKADYGENSLQDAVLQQINSPVHNWDYILEHTTLGDEYDNIDLLRKRINAGDIRALRKTAEVIRAYNWGLVDSLETFKKWITAVIDNNGLSKSGIFFIWDEFTEYVTNSEDHIILQQISEFSKVKPLFMTFIVHRTKDMIDRLTSQEYEKITDRFHQVEFHVNTDMAFDLIAGSINIRPNMENHWGEARASVVKNIKFYLPEMEGLDDKISKNINSYCPMHPMTIRLLSRVAENYAASQRTMFRFMKDQSNPEHGFVGYINKYGPDDEACWLTPDWLWDYFFMRESDFTDKDVKGAEYMHHFETSRHLAEEDENAFRIFKAAMLLLAVMSSTKGIYSGKKSGDGISATKDCLENCFAGVISKTQFNDLLQTLVDSKVLVLDEGSNNVVRIQLPFNSAGTSDFTVKLAANEKIYTRYKLFSKEKEGVFAQEMEKQAWSENDDYFRRVKVTVCCAETNSVKNRLVEVKKELEKNPYKIGVLIVIVQSEAQYNAVQEDLRNKSREENEPRLVIALFKAPLTEETRQLWIKKITNQEMASMADHSGSAGGFQQEAATILSNWVGTTLATSRVIAFNGANEINNIYGMPHLRKIIGVNIIGEIFKYAPENIAATNTVYKACNSNAPKAGIERATENGQLKNVVNALKNIGVLNITKIEDLIALKNSDNKATASVAALAEFVKNEMESGNKVNLSDLWEQLQKEPFGYYNTIACGILLGYIFSFYKNNRFTWTDSAQSSHVLTEGTLNNMVYNMCTGKTTTDYLSAGSIIWRNFSSYLEKIFNLSVEQLADQTTGYHNVREAVIQCGSPFWALKYLPLNMWISEDYKNTACEIIDKIQIFITQEGDIDNAMSETLALFKGKGKVRSVIEKAYNDKKVMGEAFRAFLFSASPELEQVATRLEIQPEELSDKLHSVMQGAIYTWTEDEVKEKLSGVTVQYEFLEAINKVQDVQYHSVEAAKRDLVNLFGFLRIPMSAIEQLNVPWYPALRVLYKVAFLDVAHTSQDEMNADIIQLNNYGVMARDCLKDGKSVLNDILYARHIECTNEELVAVYGGLNYISYDTPLTQFKKELDNQIIKVSAARNRINLQETWRAITGEDSIKSWCATHNIPLMCIVPKELNKTFNTLLDVQNGNSAVDAVVISAINSLRNMDAAILNNQAKIETAFIGFLGRQYEEIYVTNKEKFITRAKFKLGNDMSSWIGTDLPELQNILREIQHDIAKKEKLAGTKANIRIMQEAELRERVMAFLDANPEFCDEFMK